MTKVRLHLVARNAVIIKLFDVPTAGATLQGMHAQVVDLKVRTKI